MDASSRSWVLGCSSNLYPFNLLGCRYTSSRLTTIGQQLPADKGKCSPYPGASSWELQTSASAGKMEPKCKHAILNCQLTVSVVTLLFPIICLVCCLSFPKLLNNIISLRLKGHLLKTRTLFCTGHAVRAHIICYLQQLMQNQLLWLTVYTLDCF